MIDDVALLDRLTDGAVRRLRLAFQFHRFLRMSGVFGSPIELAFAVAFEMIDRLEFQDTPVITEPGLTDTQCREWVWSQKDQPSAALFPQVHINNYRVDFFAVFPVGLDGTGGIVIECDGHEFHQKTKAQVERDRERDRRLQKMGYSILRFPGSELWRDPVACASELYFDLSGRTGAHLLCKQYTKEGRLKEAMEMATQ